jgi:hypothetical protein
MIERELRNEASVEELFKRQQIDKIDAIEEMI